MTVSKIRVKLPTKFPSSVSVVAPIALDRTGGSFVFGLAPSPALITPDLGVATATSINKVAITAPATGATLTIANGKTATISNTLNFTGTDASSVAVGAGGTIGAVGYASVGQVPGEPSNGGATAGNIGEYVESILASGSAVSLVTATGKTVTSISLTAGDWDVNLTAYFIPGATTNITLLQSSVSLVTNTIDGAIGRFVQAPYGVAGLVPAANISSIVAPYRLSLSATTTVFLVVQAAFTVSTLTACGIIRARRAR